MIVAVVQAPSKHAIRAILLRTRDASAEVRLHALGVLRDKVEMRWLSISQRVHLLEGPLLDRTPTVSNACAEMLCDSWLRKGCENDVLTLMNALDAISHEKAAQIALKTLLGRDDSTREAVAKAAEYVAMKKAAEEKMKQITLAREVLSLEVVVDE